MAGGESTECGCWRRVFRMWLLGSLQNVAGGREGSLQNVAGRESTECGWWGVYRMWLVGSLQNVASDGGGRVTECGWEEVGFQNVAWGREDVYRMCLWGG